MTMQLVSCQFCFSLHEYQVMHMCPVCRKAICKRCKHDGVLKAGQCALKEPCEEFYRRQKKE